MEFHSALFSLLCRNFAIWTHSMAYWRSCSDELIGAPCDCFPMNILSDQIAPVVVCEKLTNVNNDRMRGTFYPVKCTNFCEPVLGENRWERNFFCGDRRTVGHPHALSRDLGVPTKRLTEMIRDGATHREEIHQAGARPEAGEAQAGKGGALSGR